MKLCVIHVTEESVSGPYTALFTKNAEALIGRETEMVHRYVRHLRRATDTVFMLPTLLNKVDVVVEAVAAERDGADAIMVACSGDTGVVEARTAVDIPVIGPMEAALHLATTYGSQIGIVTVQDPSWVDYCRLMTHSYGLGNRLVGVAPIDTDSRTAFTSGFTDPAPIGADIRRQCARLEHAGAQAIVIGSAGLSVISSLQGLADVGTRAPIPLFDCLSVGLVTAELRARLRSSLGVPAIGRTGVFERIDSIDVDRLLTLFNLSE